MKGVLDFLEKAGLVKNDPPAAGTDPSGTDIFGDPVSGWLPPVKRPAPAAAAAAPASSATPARAASSPAQTLAPAAAGVVAEPIRLDQIYAQEGVPPCLYPAERLLRLVDGLSAMDEATRNLALKAMDAADESWTIADPLADAAAKVTALASHAGLLRQSLQQMESETAERLRASAAKQDEAVGTIRKQIADMESLLARETARGTQENAAQEASLQVARDQAARQLAEIEAVSQRLQGLTTQFSSLAAPAQD